MEGRERRGPRSLRRIATSIESDFGSGEVEPGAWHLTLGAGGACLEAATFSGDIELRRREQPRRPGERLRLRGQERGAWT